MKRELFQRKTFNPLMCHVFQLLALCIVLLVSSEPGSLVARAVQIKLETETNEAQTAAEAESIRL